MKVSEYCAVFEGNETIEEDRDRDRDKDKDR